MVWLAHLTKSSDLACKRLSALPLGKEEVVVNPLMSIKYKTQGKFRLGDIVFIPRGWGGVNGVVVEDFGNLGTGGRRLYDVKVVLDGEEFTTNLSDDDLELVERPSANGKQR